MTIEQLDASGPRQRRALLLRHRQSTWNAERRWTGQADPPLSPAGEAEAVALGKVLSPLGFTAVVSSDLSRARRTAQLIRDAMPGATLGEDPRLRELAVPAWEGRSKADIKAADPHRYQRWRAGVSEPPPGSEPWPQFEDRVRAALEEHGAADGPTLLVAHSGVLRAVRTLFDLPHKVSRSKGIWIEQQADGLKAGPLLRLVDD